MKRRILYELRGEHDVTSGEALSKKLGISRVSIWKHIRKLKQLGCDIMATPKGYRLYNSPDTPFPWEFPGREERIHYYPMLNSTMDMAKTLARKGCPDFTVVAAGSQESGRGRLNRVWQSGEGGLYFTIVCKPRISPQSGSLISFAAALCLAKTLREEFDIAAKVKWPNDILINGKKISGMLSEMEACGDLLSFVNIGIGVNVNNDPAIAEPNAVSIKNLLRHEVSRQKLLCGFLDRFEARITAGSLDTVISEWKKYAMTIGQKVRIVTIREEYQGLATDVDEHGALLLQTEDGDLKRIFYGDCFH
jgi:BirA family transcriptional regulator, biotin operon repressor / biotin---[acetyl-CoA-carboxylase] ligase